MAQPKKISLSLKQSQLLYQYDFAHIEPISMQSRLITREFPDNDWVIMALKVGYQIFQNSSRQPKDVLPQKLQGLGEAQKDRVFLTTVLWDTLKILGLGRVFELLWILLKNIPSVFNVFYKFAVIWKGPPPDADALESILVTPLGAELAHQFRKEGILGIRQAFGEFFELQREEDINALKAARQNTKKQLSSPAISTENTEAIAASQAYFTNPSKAEHFESLQGFRDLFVAGYLELPAIADTFQDDEMFAYMRLAGPNPLMLEKLTPEKHFFDKFPVTDHHYQAVMGVADNLERAMQEGRLYGVDYAMLEGALLGTLGPTPEQPKYLYPAIALFAVPDKSVCDRYLQAIAIQCGQDPSEFPMMTATSGEYQWLAAKSAVQVADATIHEAISHLACTHLLVEPFVVSTHRQLPTDHGVYRLLTPHFQGTILINYGAWKLLTAPGQAVNSLLSPVITQSRTLAVQGLRQLRFNDQMLPKRLEARGVMDREALPLYPYRDDALLIWNAIYDWVSAYLASVYTNDAAVANDQALQNWAEEIVSLQGGRLGQFGDNGDGQILTLAYLIEALTMVIFTGSAQHAAVNFPQKGIMSFAPAMPMAGYVPPEEIPQIQTEQDWCRMLPPKGQAQLQLRMLQILGGITYTELGQYADEQKRLFGTSVQPALEKFQQRLREIEAAIDARNAELPGKFKYEYLKPSNIPQSINI